MPTVFTAKYPGRCGSACGRPIEPANAVIYVDEQLVHDECALGDGSPPAPVMRAVCPGCFTKVSVSGACNC